MTQIRAVTTIDDSLLAHVRQTLDDAEAAGLCVAFVKQRGVGRVPGRHITMRWMGP